MRMCLCTPFITLGILGSYASSDLQYNVNTCIGQTFQDFEMIFCFDSKQCIPVSDIIDSLNAHQFSAENRVKIMENKENAGLLCNAMRIAEEARGSYLFFMSTEDAFYDVEALQRIYDAAQNAPSDIHLFRTLINQKGNWSVYPSSEDLHNSVSICYPKSCLNNWKKPQISDDTNFALFQRALLDQFLRSGRTVHYTDENTIVHICSQEYGDLRGYYSLNDPWQKRIAPPFALSDEKPDLSLLSYSHTQKLLGFLDHTDLSKAEIENEFYRVYRLASDSLWEIPCSTKYYLETLRYIIACTGLSDPKKQNLSALRYRLIFLKKTKKIKILFLVHEYSVWPSLQSVYEEALKNKKFEAQLVYVPFSHEYSQTDHTRELACYQKAGYSIVSCQDYNLSKECPDIAVYVKPYDSIPARFQVKELRKAVNTIVYIPYGMEIGDTEECLYYQCYGNMQYYADYILAYSPFYLKKMRRFTYTKGSNYLSIGHPRIDLRRKNLPETKKYIHSIREKAEHRKIVLWNTHFTISEGDNWGSFLLYGDHILDYFRYHPDIFLLWRPHPLFYQALAEYRKESLQETQNWLNKITERENIMLDRSPSYLSAFRASDAMISDWASMVPEYASYGKPVLVTPKKEGSRSILSSAEKYFHIAHSLNDIDEFLDNVHKKPPSSKEMANYSKLLFFPSRKTVAKELLEILRR